MNLTALPAFTDNYIWMLDDGHEALVVDPGDSAPVLAALAARQLTLAAILVTHHHDDHVGGIEALRAHLRGPVYGPQRERIPQPFVPLAHGDRIDVLGVSFEVIDVPGHTSGHIAYFAAPAAAAPVLFCGDTLFSGGCGRLFEGTPTQMHHSLSQLAELPADTRVCCAHEYTLSNLKFARAVEPVNADLTEYTAWCEARRAQGIPTLPSSIERERLVNPFMRCAKPSVARSAREHGATTDEPVAVLAALRQWKNDFR
jgi:hydroxyacylglutathione hydrolase